MFALSIPDLLRYSRLQAFEKCLFFVIPAQTEIWEAFDNAGFPPARE